MPLLSNVSIFEVTFDLNKQTSPIYPFGTTILYSAFVHAVKSKVTTKLNRLILFLSLVVNIIFIEVFSNENNIICLPSALISPF